jgi:hypothetical protein
MLLFVVSYNSDCCLAYVLFEVCFCNRSILTAEYSLSRWRRVVSLFTVFLCIVRYHVNTKFIQHPRVYGPFSPLCNCCWGPLSLGWGRGMNLHAMLHSVPGLKCMELTSTLLCLIKYRDKFAGIYLCYIWYNRQQKRYVRWVWICNVYSPYFIWQLWFVALHCYCAIWVGGWLSGSC